MQFTIGGIEIAQGMSTWTRGQLKYLTYVILSSLFIGWRKTLHYPTKNGGIYKMFKWRSILDMFVKLGLAWCNTREINMFLIVWNIEDITELIWIEVKEEAKHEYVLVDVMEVS